MANYAVDAAELLLETLQQVQEVIDASETMRKNHSCLYDIREALVNTERLLYQHFRTIVEDEGIRSTDVTVQAIHATCYNKTLDSCVEILKSMLLEKRSKAGTRNQNKGRAQGPSYNGDPWLPRRSATDSLLFRLIVALQLCLVRIDDARYIITGRRATIKEKNNHVGVVDGANKQQLPLAIPVVATACIGFSLLAITAFPRHFRTLLRGYRPNVWSSVKLAVTAFSTITISRVWGDHWMSTKLTKSVLELDEWNSQWELVQANSNNKCPVVLTPIIVHQEPSLDIKSLRLINYALHHTPKSSFWHTQGELRFMMLKRAMDVFYASVGTAVNVTKGLHESDPVNWQITLVTAAAASFYSLTGASRWATEVTSSSASARNLIQHAWGMVSLPSLKILSLQASRLLKGAAVADRIEISNVSCFVLCAEPAPELMAAIKRFRRKFPGRTPPIHTLSTIDEQEEHTPESSPRTAKPFARSSARYRQRDVILHLTGGGFFAHIIASDLPYLMEWSASTGAVIICPEYALLPEHTFPRALLEVEAVYRALSCGDAILKLGFEVNHIILTGESVGGNLAAALCTKICMDNEKNISTPLSLSHVGTGDIDQDDYDKLDMPETSHLIHRPENDRKDMDSFYGLDDTCNSDCHHLELPCALMMSCPILNLSLELTHSRIVGTQDPVLPSGLISAISDAYLPHHGMNKKDPLVSPFYTSDAILAQFPPTLMFASSNEPLLDDSVVFNQRLRSLGVDSDLRAVQNLPHAYLGLGTAGFPEAQAVQRQVQEWLISQLARPSTQPFD